MVSYIIGIVISIAVAYYLYTDSKSRSMALPEAWGIAGFFFSLISLIVYLVVRKK